MKRYEESKAIITASNQKHKDMHDSYNYSANRQCTFYCNVYYIVLEPIPNSTFELVILHPYSTK